MMQLDKSRFSNWRICCVFLGAAALLSLNGSSFGQVRDGHLQQFADLPPGQVGQMQLARGGPLAGYFQPVRVHVPDGAQVSLWTGDHFENFDGNQADAGMLVGGVYRARVTRIPEQAGFEVYPTVEIINRLFPPQGQERKFPIPIVITQEDLERAIEGQYVVRVVYLEDPLLALPAPQREGEQRAVDVGAGEDPLLAADKLGRPMAIVRIGSRVPVEMLQGRSDRGAAPLQLFQEPAAAPSETNVTQQQTGTIAPRR
jgi:hypothetical protein